MFYSQQFIHGESNLSLRISVTYEMTVGIYPLTSFAVLVGLRSLMGAGLKQQGSTLLGVCALNRGCPNFSP
jgi:hypothetical protein